MSTSAPKALTGQVAVIVGASRRTGREVALGLAAQGATVIVTAQSSQDEIDGVAADIEEAGGKSEAHLLNVADESAVVAFFADIATRHGRLDFLVNNAAIRRQAPFLKMSLDEWREIMAINLDGVFLCCREALKIMVPQNGGTIVNLGGVSAHVGVKNRAHVAVSKSGVVGLTRSLAVEFGGHNITVNCVAPGKIGGKRSETAGVSPLSGDRILLGREGTTEEAAAAILFLCQPDARFITGQTLHVSGGLYMP